MKTFNTATLVAEAMEELYGVNDARNIWEIDIQNGVGVDCEYYEEDEEDDWWDDYGFEPDWKCLDETREWLIAHIDEYETEEYRDTRGFYSDYYKDCNGIRPHGFLNDLYLEYKARQGK